jgi:capsular exopolysaccharide synthesis family protein
MSSDWESTEEPAAPAPPAHEIHFAQYWAVIVKRWRLIAMCLFVCLAIAAAYAMLATPAYQAVAVLEISGVGSSPLEATAMGQRGGVSDSEFLPTQMRLMKSREVAARVVRRLNLADKSPAPAKPGVPQLDPVTSAALWVQKAEDVQPIRGTNLVELSYVASSPAKAASVANALADAYIESTVDARLQLAGETSSFLNGQIERLRAELEQKEQEALAFRRQNDLSSTDAKTNVTMTNVDALNADYAAAVRERVAKEARYLEVKKASPDTIANAQSDPALQQLRLEQARLEREYAEKLALFKPEWPAMLQLKAQIDRNQQQIGLLVNQAVVKARLTAETEYQAAQRREESLKSELKAQKSTVMNLNSNELEYSERHLELQTKQVLLDSLLKRKAEADVVTRLGGERASYARVVERALPPLAPFKPSYRNCAIFGLFGGAFLGVGLAFFVSYLDRSLRTTKQVEEALQVPALGVVPALSGGSGWIYRYGSASRSPRPPKTPPGETGVPEGIELLPHRHPRAAIAESYRALRTSLLLSRAGGVGSIVVTSALPKEGKTATAANLAAVLSQLGKRVLLVDADLHKPRLHEIFLVSNRTGLVSILAEGVPDASAIANTAIPDLFLLPSGPASPNPSGLLSSNAMRELLERAKRDFDHVIIDTPPVLPVADAMVLGNLTDGVILCIRAGQTARDQVLRARDLLARSGIRILGAVLNQASGEGGAYDDKSAYGYGGEGDTGGAGREGSASASSAVAGSGHP